MIYLAIGLVLGYVMGLIHKGIHIHVNNSNLPKQEGYNKSLAHMLPAEVQQYYSSTHGQNKF
jgi:hypothetical protein